MAVSLLPGITPPTQEVVRFQSFVLAKLESDLITAALRIVEARKQIVIRKIFFIYNKYLRQI